VGTNDESKMKNEEEKAEAKQWESDRDFFKGKEN